MITTNRHQVEMMLAAFATKDLDAVLALFADDAVLFDPHYPVPEMRGKAAIRRGLEWAFGNLEKPGFSVRHVWAGDGSVVVEVDTHHTFKGGMELNIAQVFVVEWRGGKVACLQAYVPYSPSGIGGALAALTRWVWKLKGKA